MFIFSYRYYSFILLLITCTQATQNDWDLKVFKNTQELYNIDCTNLNVKVLEDLTLKQPQGFKNLTVKGAFNTNCPVTIEQKLFVDQNAKITKSLTAANVEVNENFTAEDTVAVTEQLLVNGNAKVHTLTAKNVTIQGYFDADGPIKVTETFSIGNNAVLNKSLAAAQVEVRGNFTSNDTVNITDRLVINCDANVHTLTAKNLKILGSFTTNGPIKVTEKLFVTNNAKVIDSLAANAVTVQGNFKVANATITKLNYCNKLIMNNGQIITATSSGIYTELRGTTRIKNLYKTVVKEKQCTINKTSIRQKNPIVVLRDSSSIQKLEFIGNLGYVYCESDKATVETVINGERIDRTKLEELVLNKVPIYTDHSENTESSHSKWWFPGGKRPLVTYAFIGLALCYCIFLGSIKPIFKICKSL